MSKRVNKVELILRLLQGEDDDSLLQQLAALRSRVAVSDEEYDKMLKKFIDWRSREEIEAQLSQCIGQLVQPKENEV